jgi:hypothetical protein
MSKFGTIDEYISSQPEEHATLQQDLRDAILEAVPDAVEMFNYGVPAFALVKNGKRDQQLWRCIPNYDRRKYFYFFRFNGRFWYSCISFVNNNHPPTHPIK